MSISRRKWIKSLAGGAGLTFAVGGEVSSGLASTEDPKLAGTKEFTTVCNFCSCGCGMVARVRDGDLLNLEGDPDHVINQGALCSKGAAMIEVHKSSRRLKTPLYRAPGASRWQEISWNDAFTRIAQKLKDIRDRNWTALQKDGEKEYPVNRTDAIALLGGAQSTNEEAYLWNKMGRLLGTNFIEHQARL